MPGTSLLDRLLALRDRLLADPRFQRRAAAVAPLRPLVRRRSRELFDLCAGFVYSQVLLASVRLRLFDALADGPQSAAELAQRLSLPEDSALRLLDAAVSLRLAERRSHGRYGLGALGAAMLGNPGIGAMVEHHAMLYGDLADPVALLRDPQAQTRLAAYWPYADYQAPAALEAERVSDYTALMGCSQALIADEVLDAYSLRRHRCLLDVGGGDGSFLAAAAARAPRLRLQLFDLPAVAEAARARLAAAGLADRATVFDGDFHRDALPEGADVVSLVRVIHDHDDEAVTGLLRAVHRVLPAGGRVLVAEPMAGTRGAEPVGDAYFGFYLLAMGRGRPRTARELAGFLESAGFVRPRLAPTRRPLQTRLMVARKPR